MAGSSLISTSLKRLEGKVSIITGGASGIGECTARLFSKHGAKVVIADIQDELGHSVCQELDPKTTSYIHCDVTNEKDVENLVNTTVSKYAKLDIMFNNAGIVDNFKPSIVDNDKDEFQKVINVNLIGAFLGIKHAARVMIPSSKGSIISTASVSSANGGVGPHAYTSSKHALVGLTRNTAVELGQHGIRVNCVSPYAVPSQMSREFLKTDDDGVRQVYSNLKNVPFDARYIAEAALYLGSDESKFVSGHNLMVDGGFTIVNAGLCFFPQLEGKVSIITGGASGIGECTARLFSKHGAKVVIADVQDELGLSVCQELGPQTTSYVHCDVTNEKDVENLVNTAVSKYAKLDIMFNNAGIIDSIKPSIVDNEKEEFQKVINVNLIGAFLGIKHAARIMIPASRGSIISTASICSAIGGAATYAYASSKHALVGLTRNTAVELGQHGIRVNCVSPYAVTSPMTRDLLKTDDDGVRRLYSNLKNVPFDAQHIAEAALYLGSDESKFVSGHNLIVDGGFTIVNAGLCVFPQ